MGRPKRFRHDFRRPSQQMNPPPQVPAADGVVTADDSADLAELLAMMSAAAEPAAFDAPAPAPSEPASPPRGVVVDQPDVAAAKGKLEPASPSSDQVDVQAMMSPAPVAPPAPSAATTASPMTTLVIAAPTSDHSDDAMPLATTLTDPATPDYAHVLGLLPPKQREVLDELLGGRAVKEIARRHAIDPSTLYRWRTRDLLFRTAYDLGSQHQLQHAEERGRLLAERAIEILSRAMDREDKAVAIQLLKMLGILTPPKPRKR